MTGPPTVPGPPPAALPHRRLTLNALTNLTRYVASIVVAFFLTPFIVKSLGNSVYGVWVIVLSAIGYASILELGIQPAIVRLIGRYGIENRRKLEELISTAFFLFVAAGLLSAVLTTVIGFSFAGRAGAMELHQLRTVIAIIAIDLALMFQVTLLSGVLFGLHRYPLRNGIDVMAMAVNAAIVVMAVSSHGIGALAAAKLVTDAGSLVALATAVRRLLPGIRLSWAHVSRRSLAEVFSSGGPLFASSALTRASNYTQPIIISAAISTAATTFFAIPLRLIDYSREILYALATGFMPTFSELATANRLHDVRVLYVKYSRLLVLATLPLNVLVFLLGAPFIALWIGPEYAIAGRFVVGFLAAGAFLESCQPLLWRLMIGVGHLARLVQASILGSVSMVIGSVLLVRPFGIAGVAFAMLLAMAGTQVLFTVHVSRYLGVETWTLLRRMLARPILIGAITFVTATLGVAWLGTDSYSSLAAITALTTTVHGGLALAFGLDEDERAFVTRRLRRRS